MGHEHGDKLEDDGVPIVSTMTEIRMEATTSRIETPWCVVPLHIRRQVPTNKNLNKIHCTKKRTNAYSILNYDETTKKGSDCESFSMLLYQTHFELQLQHNHLDHSKQF